MIDEQTSKTNIPELARELLHLPFDQVVPSDTNPRLSMEKEPFDELKKSIYANGLLQPIVVRPKGDVYEIIGGHRRYFALRDLASEHPKDKRFSRIAVVVVDVDDSMVPVLQLAENLNRSDLSPVEVAEGVARAVTSGVDAQQLADNLGWTRRHLNRYLGLGESPAWLREFAREVKVTRKKLAPDGQVVIDAKTEKAAVEIERLPGLSATYLFELVALFGVLREADALQLEEVGGELFRPQAERTTKRLAKACAVEGWTVSRLKVEVKRAKDPAPARQPRGSSPPPPASVAKDKLVVDLRRAIDLSPAERNELAAQITKALAAFKFKSVVITP